MPRRRIGQEALGFGGAAGERSGSLDELRGLVDWAAADAALKGVHAAAHG